MSNSFALFNCQHHLDNISPPRQRYNPASSNQFLLYQGLLLQWNDFPYKLSMTRRPHTCMLLQMLAQHLVRSLSLFLLNVTGVNAVERSVSLSLVAWWSILMEKFQLDDPPGSYDDLIAGVSSKWSPSVQ